MAATQKELFDFLKTLTDKMSEKLQEKGKGKEPASSDDTKVIPMHTIDDDEFQKAAEKTSSGEPANFITRQKFLNPNSMFFIRNQQIVENAAHENDATTDNGMNEGNENDDVADNGMNEMNVSDGAAGNGIDQGNGNVNVGVVDNGVNDNENYRSVANDMNDLNGNDGVCYLNIENEGAELRDRDMFDPGNWNTIDKNLLSF
ncbi:N66 matrix protein-like [Papaver somniferum]|uniref:N66 matrix protein-like n=1 Tax=Papaver somniferum TaxID=3469 RepID=UPI000E6F4EA1|nr:N66 matrix protein-like [Papaver somniferum]